MNPDYFVYTQLIIDDVYFPDGRNRLNQLGGGTYTAAGMRYWSKKVGFCSGIGPDYTGRYDDWFLRNGIDVVKVNRTEKCTHARINYFPDGEREELLLPGYGSHALMLPQADEIPPEYHGCKGMYIFKDCDEAYWADIKNFLRRHPMTAVWEIHGAAAVPQNEEAIAEILSAVELFSLNLTEGKRLTGKEQPADIIRRLHALHAKVLILRMGENGAMVSDEKNVWHIPAAPACVVDVTGGGNSSTGGFLAAYCESGGDAAWAGRCAAVSASHIIAQYGVPPVIDEAAMDAARCEAEALPAEKV